MSVISKIIAELKRSDDQGRDWYGWTTNQMGHAFSFMALAIIFAPWIAAALAVAKEGWDAFRVNNRDGWKDSATDLFFCLAGVALVVVTPSQEWAVLAVVAIALAVGIVRRVRAS